MGGGGRAGRTGPGRQGRCPHAAPRPRSRAARVESEGYPIQRAVSCIQSISVSKQTSFSTILDKVILTYNSQPHRTIKTTPNEMYNDINKQIFNFEKDKEYNRNV